MKIAFLCKRHYMRQDVIVDRYARLYELPTRLARLGIQVSAHCLSYRAASSGLLLEEPGIDWRSYHVSGVMSLALSVLREKPDLILGASDSVHIILASFLARRLKIPYMVDLYDNFESFQLTQVPGLLRGYRHALAQAAQVSCVSRPLADYVASHYRGGREALVLESTIDPQRFFPMKKSEARRNLGLPVAGRFVGTAGALDRGRGIEALYGAYEQLSASCPDLHLILAGRAEKEMPVPVGPNILYLGELSHAQMTPFWNALDVGVICVQGTAFGRYSFPQKLYEVLACDTPVAASSVGAIADTLASTPAALFSPDDISACAGAIRSQLEAPQRPRIIIPSWSDQAARLAVAMETILN